MTETRTRNLTAAILAGVLALVMLAVAALAVGADRASAVNGSGPATGSARLDFSFGQAGKVLNERMVTVVPISGASEVRSSARRTSVSLSAKYIVVNGDVGVTFQGGIRFKLGKRGVGFGSLALRPLANGIGIEARPQGGSPLTLFRAAGPFTLDREVETISFDSGRLTLTTESADLIKRRLGLKSLPAGQVGSINAVAQEQFAEPWTTECGGLAANTKVSGTVTPADPPPTITPDAGSLGNGVIWSFRAPFLSAFYFGGDLQGLDGSSVIFPPAPGAPPVALRWPLQSSQLDGSGTDARAVINGRGTIMGCLDGLYRVEMSNPTVVLDGAESRLIIDLDTNREGEWIANQRVVLATLDLSSATVNDTGTQITWSGIPVTVTEDGAEALRLCVPADDPNCPYPNYRPGGALDALTVSLDRFTIN